MKTRTNRFIRRGTAVIALAAAIAAAPGFAAPERGDPERMLERMTRHLELSESQQSAIGELLQEAAAEGAEDRARMKEIREALREQGENFDATASESLTRELGEVTARSAYRRTETRAAVRDLLNEEQRAELDAAESERGKKGGKHGSPGERPRQ
ncbi:MAG TPA: hypothetical protein DCQ70_14380 [Halieaceae bacterium]|nr:hypothetical protein [Halieaceae bacterium]